ncbi:MAG: zf-HC2 domain-containing protein [Candidatus Bipolaricaulota bacterium]
MSHLFEDELLKALEGEVAAQRGPHLDEGEIGRWLRGRVSGREAEALAQHLAACHACRGRLNEAREPETEMAAARRLAIPRTARRRVAPLRVLGFAGALLGVAAVLISLGHTHGVPSGAALPAGARAVEAPGAAEEAAPLTPAAFAREAATFSEYPAFRAAAYTIGLLRKYGVPLEAPSLAFRSATIYIAEPGDTWERVAERALGDPALWPIVLLLNLDLSPDGAFVPPGTYLRVPHSEAGA